MHMNVHSNFTSTHNSPKLETAQVSFNDGLNWYIHTVELY